MKEKELAFMIISIWKQFFGLHGLYKTISALYL